MALTDWQVAYNDITMGPGTDYYLNEITGLGEVAYRPEVLTKSERHGAFTFATFLEARTVTLQGIIIAANDADRLARLNDLKAAFAPQGEDLPLTFKFAGETQKRVFCKPLRRQWPTRDRMYRAQVVPFAIQLVAGDPFIYEDDGTIINPGGDETSNPGGPNQCITPVRLLNGIDFDVEFSIDFQGGTGGICSVNNAGTNDVSPKCTIRGPVNGPRLSNLTTAKSLRTTTDVLADETLTIDFATRSITLTTASGTENKFGDLVAKESSWWVLERGINQVQFDEVSQTHKGTSDTQLTIEWRNASL